MTEIARRESEFLLYSAPDGAVKVGVLFRDETAWLTQRALAALFGVKVPAITKHLKNIFDSRELDKATTVSKMEMVQSEGGRDVLREVTLYNLDAIIAVGYRVNSAGSCRVPFHGRIQTSPFHACARYRLTESISAGAYCVR